MERTDKINAVKSLINDYNNNVDIQSDYTTKKFDFLVEDGLLSSDVTKYYEQARKDYLYDLTNLQHTGDIVLAHTVAQVKISLMKGIENSTQKKYITNLAKIVALKEFVKNYDIEKLSKWI